jgi:hypothetical protein
MNSPLLDSARANFDMWCAQLRTDNLKVSVYAASAGAAAGLAGIFGAAAFASGNWVTGVILGAIATVLTAVAIAFLVLANQAASSAGLDLTFLNQAQQSWRNAIAAVKRACCPAWIVIDTNDLVCP